MHYSADKDDHGAVFLNGVEIPFAVECDTEAGWVTAIHTDAEGKPTVAPDENGVPALVLYTVIGEVSFVPRAVAA